MNPAPSISSLWLEHLARHPGEVVSTGSAGEAFAFDEAIQAAKAMLLEAKAHGKKVLIIGNGGSAAIASHMQTDLCHSLGIRGLVFNEPPLLTALSNDNGYENAFQRLVDLWGDAGDVLVAISSSGRSANILNACAAARARGLGLITYSGFGADNPLRGKGDLNFYVANANYGPVESAHAVLVHHLTDQVLAHLRAQVPA
ncbi:phosphoheptose isomerase [Geothrix limicola]|uniref:Phosphoheptose isomerase n=1 Tax=Geothrix limicola TaxID=2927978 RepID=A0ABQ5QFM7_9BACT|nr:SIS domain-containing protein [Geothrix limicola]GLH73168.1 phosphoheptose isomerase [Geothrix limicola]